MGGQKHKVVGFRSTVLVRVKSYLGQGTSETRVQWLVRQGENNAPTSLEANACVVQ